MAFHDRFLADPLAVGRMQKGIDANLGARFADAVGKIGGVGREQRRKIRAHIAQQHRPSLRRRARSCRHIDRGCTTGSPARCRYCMGSSLFGRRDRQAERRRAALVARQEDRVPRPVRRQIEMLPQPRPEIRPPQAVRHQMHRHDREVGDPVDAPRSPAACPPGPRPAAPTPAGHWSPGCAGRRAT